MPSDSENGQRQLSDGQTPSETIVEAVREAVNDWVEEDEIPVRREGDEIVAEEENLVENISIMIAIAVNEAAE